MCECLSVCERLCVGVGGCGCGGSECVCVWGRVRVRRGEPDLFKAAHTGRHHDWSNVLLGFYGLATTKAVRQRRSLVAARNYFMAIL